MSSRRTFVSLFSGCGGFDAGFVDAGFRPKAAFDIWPLAAEVYRENIGKHIHVADLAHADLTSVGRCDVVLAGSPCQGFSPIGKRRLDDPRNHLLTTGVRLAITLKPKAIVLENVPGLLHGDHRRYFDHVVNLLRGADYETAHMVVDASQCGVAQRRKRVILVAWRHSRRIQIVLPASKAPSLSDALAGCASLPNHDPMWLEPGSDDFKIASRIQPGQKLSDVRAGESSVHSWDVPEVFGAVTRLERQALEAIVKLRRTNRTRSFGDADPVSVEALRPILGATTTRTVKSLLAKNYVKLVGADINLRHGFNGKYRRLDGNAPSLTVDTRFGNPKNFLHPLEQRGYSVREAARIQGFPDEFRFSGSTADQFRLVGNAVPPPLAHCVATAIREALF